MVKLNIRLILLVTVFVVGLIFLYSLFIRKISPKPSNLIFISVDTLRQDHMGIYGYEKNTTPNVDNWAKQATVFTNAYTIFPLTFQSFYTLFTGKDIVLKDKNFQSAGSVGLLYNLSSPTLSSILKSHGYTTAAFVTNPVIDPLGINFFKDGFTLFKSFDRSKQSQFVLDAVHQNNTKKSSSLFHQIFKEDYSNSQKATKESINWIKNNKNSPFFLWVHYSNPHEPYNPERETLCTIDKKKCEEEIYNKLLKESITRCINNPKPKDENIIEGLESMYDAEIKALDIEIGKLLSVISSENLENDTVVVFYGDHGESFKPELLSHGYSIYNSEVKIPLIIKLPSKARQSGANSSLIDNTDILPTILHILKIQYNPDVFTGVNFIDEKYKWKVNPKDFVYFMNPFDWSNKYGVTDGKYKYIYSDKKTCLSQKDVVTELYNIENDPKEEINLVENVNSNLPKKLMNYFQIEKNSGNQDDIDKIKSLGY